MFWSFPPYFLFKCPQSEELCKANNYLILDFVGRIHACRFDIGHYVDIGDGGQHKREEGNTWRKKRKAFYVCLGLRMKNSEVKRCGASWFPATGNFNPYRLRWMCCEAFQHHSALWLHTVQGSNPEKSNLRFEAWLPVLSKEIWNFLWMISRERSVMAHSKIWTLYFPFHLLPHQQYPDWFQFLSQVCPVILILVIL